MTSFNGLGMHLGNLPLLSSAKTRSISPENFTGDKGKGAMATEGTGANCARDLGRGWKISPSIQIEPGDCRVLADIDGPGAIQHIWMTATGHWRFSILRIYWDGSRNAVGRVPAGRFLRLRVEPIRAGFVSARVRESRQRLQLLLGDALQKEVSRLPSPISPPRR